MADLNFGFSGLSNKVSIPVIGAVDGTIALLAGGIILIILIVLLYKILHRKKTSGPPPEHGQQGTHPAPWKEGKPAEIPRRLQKRGGETETPPRQETAPTKPLSGDKSSEIARQLKGETVSARATQPSQRRERKGGNDLELLAGDLAEQNERDEKAKKELEELRKKLGMAPTTEEMPTGPVPALQEEASEQSGDKRHGRWRERREEKPEAKPPQQRREHGRRAKQASASTAPAFQQPTESESQLEQLKKMEFKDLLKESDEAKGEKSEEEELKELEGEEGEEPLAGDEEGPQKCPNCKRTTEKILYCPECGTGFCSQCAKSFKKQGNDEFYQCPSCEAYVKAGHD